MKTAVSFRTKSWCGDQEIEMQFPAEWTVTVVSHKKIGQMTGHNIQEKLNTVIGCQPLENQVKAGMKVAIVCDDISRPTRTDIILPLLIRKLLECGVSRDRITVMAASGMHPQMSMEEKISKFGGEIVSSLRIVDHNPFRGNEMVGKTSRGTPVIVNSHIAGSDLVVGIGGVYPSTPAGFGGGAKLILGASSSETIKFFHLKRKGVDQGKDVHNEFRDDLLEAARLCRMNFVINALISEERQIVNLYCGDIQAAFSQAVKSARDIYRVIGPKEGGFNVVICDTYPFDHTLIFSRKGWWPAFGCDYRSHRLVVCAMPRGIGSHKLFPFVEGRYHKLMARIFHLRTSSMASLKAGLQRKLSSRGKREPLQKEEQEAYLNSLKGYCPGQERTPSIIPGVSIVSSLDDFFQEVRRSLPGEVKVGFYRASGLTFTN